MTQKHYTSLALWLAIFALVATLPYAILPLNWLLNHLSVASTRTVIAGAVVITLLLLLFVLGRRAGYSSLISTIWIPIAACLSVVWVESNTIKYSHIPQYFLLCVLIFLAVKNQTETSSSIALAFLCSVLFGIFDEVHQGIHPARYFGWRDMWINSCGALIGAWTIWHFTRMPAFPRDDGTHVSHPRSKLPLRLFFVLVLTLVLSIKPLFYAAGVGHLGNFPLWWSVGMTFLAMLGLMCILWNQRKIPFFARSWFYWPGIILSLILLTIGLAAAAKLPFR